MPNSLPRGKALVLQSGGPTRVINRSLRGVLEGVYAANLGDIYGSMHGIIGVLNEDFVNLRALSCSIPEMADTPGAALGTTRYEFVKKTKDGETEIREGDAERAIKVLEAHNIRYAFIIGGGDSSETALVLSRKAKEMGYGLCVMHVPKTIDNDLLGTDHCPGYPSAAAFVINYLLGTYADALSFGETIDLNVVMGRNTGWLASAAAFCRKRGNYNPLIITPENPMTIGEFAETVKVKCMKNKGVLQVAVSEGARDSEGEWAKNLAKEIGFKARKDITGRDILSDIPLANLLSLKLKETMGEKTRIVADTLGYGQRSFTGTYSQVDIEEAEMVGRHAVHFAVDGAREKMIGIERSSRPEYSVSCKPVELSSVAEPGKKMIREVPKEFFHPDGQPNDNFVEWLEPLVESAIGKFVKVEAGPVDKILKK